VNRTLTSSEPGLGSIRLANTLANKACCDRKTLIYLNYFDYYYIIRTQSTSTNVSFHRDLFLRFFQMSFLITVVCPSMMEFHQQPNRYPKPKSMSKAKSRLISKVAVHFTTKSDAPIRLFKIVFSIHYFLHSYQKIMRANKSHYYNPML
jgi:hypothetical protein